MVWCSHLFQNFPVCGDSHNQRVWYMIIHTLIDIYLYSHIYKFFGEGYGNSVQYSCLENPVDRGAWWAAVHRVTQSRTPLKQLSKAYIYKFYHF